MAPTGCLPLKVRGDVNGCTPLHCVVSIRQGVGKRRFFVCGVLCTGIVTSRQIGSPCYDSEHSAHNVHYFLVTFYVRGGSAVHTLCVSLAAAAAAVIIRVAVAAASFCFGGCLLLKIHVFSPLHVLCIGVMLWDERSRHKVRRCLCVRVDQRGCNIMLACDQTRRTDQPHARALPLMATRST